MGGKGNEEYRIQSREWEAEDLGMVRRNGRSVNEEIEVGLGRSAAGGKLGTGC